MTAKMQTTLLRTFLALVVPMCMAKDTNDWQNDRPPPPPMDEEGTHRDEGRMPPPDRNGTDDDDNRPAPPGWDGKGRPPPPPDGFRHGRGKNESRSDKRNKRKGGDRREPPQGGGRGEGRPGGGRHGDDPSNPSIYSGIETVESGSKMLVGKTIVSSSQKNTAPVYVKTGAKASVKNAKITSSVSGANGILVIGKGAKATVENTTITTTANSSRGLYAFQQGEIAARNVKISTQGAHCAAMATDRGEGKVMVDTCVLDTAGDGSPSMYSTGELSAKNSTGTATGSEAMVIEGRNSIRLENTRLVGYRKCGAMLYQSFSGDAREGVATLSMKDSALEAKTGPLFYVTNTRAEIDLENCELTDSPEGMLLKASAGRWGRSGSNGGKVTLRAANQTLAGDVSVDGASEVSIELGNGATLTGAINSDGKGKVAKLTLAKNAKFVLTGDTFLTSLVNADPTGNNIVRNGYKLRIVNQSISYAQESIRHSAPEWNPMYK